MADPVYSLPALLMDYREAQNALEESLRLFRELEQYDILGKDVLFKIRNKAAYLDRVLLRLKGLA